MVKTLMMQSARSDARSDARGNARPGSVSSVGGVMPDSRSAAALRVHLKLKAIAYDRSYSSSAANDMNFIAMCDLCGAAVRYGAELMGPIKGTVVDPTLAMGDSPSEEASEREIAVIGMRIRLKLAALSYAGTRHGFDGHTEFTRDALGELCRAAVDYRTALVSLIDS